MRRPVDTDERAPLEAEYDSQEYEDTVTFKRAEGEMTVDPETVISSGALTMLHLLPIIRPVVWKKRQELRRVKLTNAHFIQWSIAILYLAFIADIFDPRNHVDLHSHILDLKK